MVGIYKAPYLMVFNISSQNFAGGIGIEILTEFRSEKHTAQPNKQTLLDKVHSDSEGKVEEILKRRADLIL